MFGRDGILGWFARNSVAANMLMLALLIGGFLAFLQTRQEVFPSLTLDVVRVQVAYPGASPEEIEEGILLPVEGAVESLDVIKRITAVATEGLGTVSIELADGVDVNAALQDVRGVVDGITTFPEDAEEPGVYLASNRRQVMKYGIFGEMPEAVRYQLADALRKELLQLPEVTQVEISGLRTPEMRVEIDTPTLRALGLTLGDVAGAIRRHGLDIPGGGLRTDKSEILLRTSGRRDVASQLADVPLLGRADGGRVLLGDVAVLSEGFADVDRAYRINGLPAFAIAVFQVGESKPLEVAEAVKGYFERAARDLPEAVGYVVLDDTTEAFRDRVSLLLDNGLVGFLLVLLLLTLFLAPRLAFWVAAGIPIAMVGAFVLLPGTDATINMISLFAFIMVLGIVVDDAIIVGEQIFQRLEHGEPLVDAAVAGVREMFVPVFLAVSTNIIAFLPLLLAPGTFGQLLGDLPRVAVCVFAVSLVEALFILPSHIAHHGAPGEPKRLAGRLARRIERWRGQAAWGFTWLRDNRYAPLLDRALEHRLVTVAIFVSALALTVVWVASGRLPVQFAPSIEGREVRAQLTMAQGVPFARTLAVAEAIEAAGLRVGEAFGPDAVVAHLLDVGATSSHVASIVMNLGEADRRRFTLTDFTKRWRDSVGELADVESLTFNYMLGPGASAAIAIELSHRDRDVLRAAAAELAAELANYSGVAEIDDGFTPGKPQLDFTLTAEAQAYGLTLAALGQQLRDHFEGAEALRQLRERDEVRIKVRPPEAERRSLAELDTMVLRLPGGGEIPLRQAARVRYLRAAQEIERQDGQAVVRVTANVIPGIANANQVQETLAGGYLGDLVERHPGLTWDFGGQMRDQRETVGYLGIGLLACLAAIYALLASAFRSYLQSLVVMLTIPFSVAAAVMGHALLGYPLSAISLFGVIALTGLVINGSQVLMLKINEERHAGLALVAAVREACLRRFRPILLTYMTTTVGLLPLLFETSIQARFLIPMAIALSFGTLFAAFVVLLFIPALYLLLQGRAARTAAAAPVVAAAPLEG